MYPIMYLLLAHEDLFDNYDDVIGNVVLKATTAPYSDKGDKAGPPCTKRPRLLEGERRSIRFVPEEENVWHEIPHREELMEDQRDVMFYRREDLKEFKRLAKQEARIIELTCTDDCTEDSFFHEIVQVDAQQLQSIRIFLNGDPPVSSAATLSCCLRGLERHTKRYAVASKTKKVRAKGLETVLMGQERIQLQRRRQQQQSTFNTWRNWRNGTKETAADSDTAEFDLDAVAQLYQEVAVPSVEAALQRAAYDELEAKAIHSSGLVQ
jgi:hypothetical protein